MKRFQNILYVAEPAVDQSAAMARAVSLARNNQASLTVVDVIPTFSAGIGMPPGGPITTALQQAIMAEHQAALERLVEPFRGTMAITLRVLEGRTFLEAIREVLRHGHDLLIKPAENPDLVERLFGSNDMHLLRKCPCPVWLMKPGEKDNYRHIVAAIDFDPWHEQSIEQPLNRQLLELATSIALSDFASLHLVHAWDALAEELVHTWSAMPIADAAAHVEDERMRHRAGLERLSRRIDKAAGAYLSPILHLPRGAARQVIPEVVRAVEADLVIMGTVARSGIPGLFIGNTAEAILDQLTCSVLAIKPPGFVTPVTID